MMVVIMIFNLIFGFLGFVDGKEMIFYSTLNTYDISGFIMRIFYFILFYFCFLKRVFYFASLQLNSIMTSEMSCLVDYFY